MRPVLPTLIRKKTTSRESERDRRKEKGKETEREGKGERERESGRERGREIKEKIQRERAREMGRRREGAKEKVGIPVGNGPK